MVPEVQEGSERNDSNIIVFNNSSRDVIVKDDEIKYIACQGYNEANAANDTAKLADYSIGTQKIVTDGNGDTYVLHENYGKLIRFNPNYPVDMGATKGGGWYRPENQADGEVTVTDTDGNTFKITSLAEKKVIDSGYYKFYNYLYSAKDDFAKGYSSSSKVRKEKVKGSMSISAANDFHFREDYYRTKEVKDDAGNVQEVVVDGTLQTNPNAAKYNELTEFASYNQLYFDGDETVTKEADQWHYVTTVIQNDWVAIYVDGVEIDAEEQYGYWVDSDIADKYFNGMNAGKTFNQGRGIRGIYAKPKENIGEWSTNGTAKETPANSLGITMLDWLTDEGTELTIGGVGYAAKCFQVEKYWNQNNVKDTMVDDITFYNVPFTKEQAEQAYENACADMEAEIPTSTTVTVPEASAKFTFDDNKLESVDSKIKMEPAPTNIADKNPSVAIDPERGYVLQIEESKASATSAVKLSQNPFAGKDIKSATVSYWVKMETAGDSIAVSFQDTKKVKDHPKISATYKGKESAASATQLWVKTSLDSYFEEGVTNGVYESLKNKFWYSTMKNNYTDTANPLYDQDSYDKMEERKQRLLNSVEWHFITAVMTNSGIQIFYDGKELPNNLEDENGLGAYYGPRLSDGYASKVCDGFSTFYAPSQNQFATSIMAFLTDETTSAYFGYANIYGSEVNFNKTYLSYFDNISYFDSALTAAQVQKLYEIESGQDHVIPTPEPTEDVGGGGGEKDNKGTVSIEKNADGSLTASYGGVTINAPAGVLPDDAVITLGRLGTDTSADLYSKFETLFAGISDFKVARFVLYTISAKTAEGVEITPNGEFELTFDIPSGYNKDAIVVVGEDGKIYDGVISADGTKVTIKTSKMGTYAVAEKELSKEDGSKIASGSSSAGKTGDTANIVIPFVMIALAGATLVVTLSLIHI